MSFSEILTNLLWINIIFAIVVIILERRNPITTWMWIAVLLLLPGVGFFIYLWLGRSVQKQKRFQNKTVTDKKQSDEILKHRKNEAHEGDDNPYSQLEEYSDQIRMHAMNSGALLTIDNEFEPFFKGEEYFSALYRDIKNAKKSVYLQTYIIRSDKVGKKLIQLLIDKKKQGLDVKFLVDGMGARGLRKKDLTKLRDEGVEAEVFYPFFISFISPRINYRNHRKITVIDGEIGYLGGYNIGNEYINGGKKFESWRDSAIRIEGSAVGMLAYKFLLDFSYAGDKKQPQHQFSAKEFTGNGACQIVSSGPDSVWPSIKDGYLKMISSAKKTIYIETPYFIPDASIIEGLRVASLSGVDVKIMIPFKGDHIFVYWANLAFVGELLEAGCKIYFYEKGFQHSKVLIMDDKIVSVGTANMDIRSFSLNFEVNAFVYDKELVKKFSDKFLEDIEQNSKELTINDYRNRSNYTKLKESISRLFSPIL